MKRWPAQILLLMLISALIAALLLAWLHKKVIIRVDDRPQNLTTFALTVGGVLRAADLPLGVADSIEPPLDAWISDGQIITLERAAAVQISADGELHNILSTARRALDWLIEAGVAYHAGDALYSNGLPLASDALLPQASAYSLQVIRPVNITLQTNHTSRIITSTAATLGQALWQVGIQLHVADRLTPVPNTPLTGDLTASLIQSRPITIETAAGSLFLRSASANVGEALAEAGLAPQGLDYAIPAASAAIPTDGTIRLVRVREEVLIEQTALPFGSDWQPVDDLELDQRQLVQPGGYGIWASRVRLRYEDDVQISRVIESEWQAQAPVNEIVGYGMQIVMRTLDSPDGPVNYYRALQFWATAYAPKYLGGSSRTASGQTLRKGLVSVDTAYIPFGTLLYIPGYGFAEAADTGRISGRWIDLGFSDDDFEGWHQWVTVYFLWPPGFVPPVIPPPSHY